MHLHHRQHLRALLRLQQRTHCRHTSSSSSSSSSNLRPLPTFEDVSRAGHRVRGGVVRTACRLSPNLSELCGMQVFIKEELGQLTGSFKERGARNALAELTPEQRAVGVKTASAGNHALALSYHGRQLGIPVTCVMPTMAPLTKIEQCAKHGAEIVLHGQHLGEAREHAMTLPQLDGMPYINGYDDPAIIAGAGTMGLEILEQVSDLDAIVVPVGGAGLIAGVALAVKTLRPEIDLLGVEPEHCPSFQAALDKGAPLDAFLSPTLADGLAVPAVGPHAFEVAKDRVDATVSVSEKAIALAVLRLLELQRCTVEGGGATGLAALLPGQPLHERLQGKRVCVPLCGGNIDITTLGRVIERGLAADHRLVRFAATVSDRPGGIAQLTQLLGAQGVSIKDIHHERAWLSDLHSVVVRVVCETKNKEHTDVLREALGASPFAFEWG